MKESNEIPSYTENLDNAEYQFNTYSSIAFLITVQRLITLLIVRGCCILISLRKSTFISLSLKRNRSSNGVSIRIDLPFNGLSLRLTLLLLILLVLWVTGLRFWRFENVLLIRAMYCSARAVNKKQDHFLKNYHPWIHRSLSIHTHTYFQSQSLTHSITQTQTFPQRNSNQTLTWNPHMHDSLHIRILHALHEIIHGKQYASAPRCRETSTGPNPFRWCHKRVHFYDL